jgi:hypothetical protein
LVRLVRYRQFLLLLLLVRLVQMHPMILDFPSPLLVRWDHIHPLLLLVL